MKPGIWTVREDFKTGLVFSGGGCSFQVYTRLDHLLWGRADSFAGSTLIPEIRGSSVRSSFNVTLSRSRLTIPPLQRRSQSPPPTRQT
jgi:hypothetical protein